MSKAEVVAVRKKWKDEIEAKIWEHRQRKLGLDVIVRDVKRIDEYPDITPNKRGISAWYEAGLMGTYHRGIQLGLSWRSLTRHKGDRWRYTNHAANEKGDLNTILIGYVRYENIEGIDWGEDEYYGGPQIYCHFDARHGEPYEKLAFYERKELNNIPFYTEIAPYEPVRKLSKRLRIR